MVLMYFYMKNQNKLNNSILKSLDASDKDYMNLKSCLEVQTKNKDERFEAMAEFMRRCNLRFERADEIYQRKKGMEGADAMVGWNGRQKLQEDDK